MRTSALAPVALALSVALASSSAQDSGEKTDKTFFTRRDLAWVAGGMAASGLVSVFDKRIENWWQQPSRQGTQSRHDAVKALTTINETPLTLAAVGVYAVGRLAHAKTVGDVGAHWMQAMVLTVATSEMIRGPLGRARPRASPDDQYRFDFGGGFSKFEDRAWPSLHAAAAFATATVFVEEMRERNASATPVVAPLLYAAATIPGFTRMYLNQHWASDIVAGSVLGALIGSRVVTYGHRHHTKIDRWLLGATLVPTAAGGVDVGLNLSIR